MVNLVSRFKCVQGAGIARSSDYNPPPPPAKCQPLTKARYHSLTEHQRHTYEARHSTQSCNDSYKSYVNSKYYNYVK